MRSSRASFERACDRLLDPPDDETAELFCDFGHGWWEASREDERCPACDECSACGTKLDEWGSGTCDECARHACMDCDETLAPLVAIRCAECAGDAT